MAITYDGAVYLGPEVDTTRNYSVVPGNVPTGDFAIWITIRLNGLFTGDPTGVSPTLLSAGQNYAYGNSGTGGADCSIRFNSLNNATTALRGTILTRLAGGGVNSLAAGGAGLTSTSTFKNGDIVTVVVQCSGGSAGNIEQWTCKPGGSAILEASGARNSAYTAKSLGTWLLGPAAPMTIQSFGIVTQALTAQNITDLANGVDPETIVTTTANRQALWLLNSTAASIPATWGTQGAATRNGSSWANQTARSPLTPKRRRPDHRHRRAGALRGRVHQRRRHQPFLDDPGIYAGTAPTAMQGRLENPDSTDALAWTDLGSFTASGGTWTGTLTPPVGGFYRLHVRDKNNPTRVWRGASQWLCAPTHVSMGQSPYTFFEQQYPGLGATLSTSAKAVMRWPGVDQMILMSSTNAGAGLIEATNTWTTITGGKPVAWLLSAVPGTSSNQWAARDSTVWPDMLAGLDYVKPQRVLCSWLNGAADSSNGDNTIKANHDTILANLTSDLTTSRGITFRYRVIHHNRDTGAPTSAGNTRRSQLDWTLSHPQLGTKVLLGTTWLDMMVDTEHSGTVQSATSTTVTLDPADQTSAGAGLVLTIVSGTGAGQTRTMSAYNTTTRVATVPAWTTIPDATSTYRWAGNGSPHPAVIGVRRFGPRYAVDTAAKFGLVTDDARGPMPVSAAYVTGDGTVIDVTYTLPHGTSLRTPNGGTAATNVAGFEVSESYSTAADGTLNFNTLSTIASAVIQSPTKVRLTLAAAPADKTKIRVRSGSKEPIAQGLFDANPGGLGDLIYDNSGIAPLGGVPAYSTRSADLTPAVAAVASLITAGFFA